MEWRAERSADMSDDVPPEWLYVPPDFVLDPKATLGDAITWWEQGVVSHTDESGRTHQIRPFKLLKQAHWTHAASRKHFGNWLRAFKKLTMLQTLCNTDSFATIIGEVEAFVEHFRRRYNARGYDAAVRATAAHSHGEYDTQPLRQKMRTVYLHLTTCTKTLATDWYQASAAAAAAAAAALAAE